MSRNRLITAGVVALFALPPLGALVVRGWTVVFHHFAGDAYLYLTVGRNFADSGVFTMDRIHPTNGFHPLWQVFLGVVYWLAGLCGAGEPVVLVTVFLVNTALVAAALWLVCRAHETATGRVPVLHLLLPLGFMGMLLATYPTAFGPRGTLWGFVNGMETGLTLLGYGLLTTVLVRPDPAATRRDALVLGALLAGLVLARLDNVFLVAAVGGTAGLRALLRRDGARFRLAVLTVLPAVATLLVYMGVNLLTTGLALPVSFLAKSTPPGLGKFAEVAAVLAAPDPLYVWRLAQILVPLAVGIVAVAHHWRAWRKPALAPLERVSLVTAVFVVITGIYHFVFVPTLDQGHWYFPVSILFTTWFVVHLLDRPPLRRVVDAWPVAVVCVLVTAFFYVRYHRPADLDAPRVFTRLVTTEAAALRAHYGAREPRLLSFEDGILAYATGWPVMTGRGYLLDREAIGFYRDAERSLLKLAYERGFDLLPVSPVYRPSPLRRRPPPRQVMMVLSRQPWLTAADLRDFTFTVDYVSADGNLVLVKMTPRGDGARRRRTR